MQFRGADRLYTNYYVFYVHFFTQNTGMISIVTYCMHSVCASMEQLYAVHSVICNLFNYTLMTNIIHILSRINHTLLQPDPDTNTRTEYGLSNSLITEADTV